MEQMMPTLTSPLARTPDTTTEWDEFARTVDRMVDVDDPRLPTLVLDLEARLGCGLGTADRSAPMLGRRFARAHRIALSDPHARRH